MQELLSTRQRGIASGTSRTQTFQNQSRGDRLMIYLTSRPPSVSVRFNPRNLGRFGRFIHKFYVEKINRVVVFLYIRISKQPSEPSVITPRDIPVLHSLAVASLFLLSGDLGKQYPAASLSTSRDPQPSVVPYFRSALVPSAYYLVPRPLPAFTFHISSFTFQINEVPNELS
jgi:hypothetical protein